MNALSHTMFILGAFTGCVPQTQRPVSILGTGRNMDYGSCADAVYVWMQFQGVSFVGNDIWLVMEYAAGGACTTLCGQMRGGGGGDYKHHMDCRTVEEGMEWLRVGVGGARRD
jgi:hypothetical protein